jgi:uncharacterized repeat protein (TIGR02543 family)
MKEILGIREIHFNTNGGNPVPVKQNVWRDEKITKPVNPSKSGFIFDGWFKDNETFESPWNFDDYPEGDMTLHAKWNYIEIITILPSGITIIQQPVKTIYVHGEQLDLSGLIVKVSYSDDSEKDIPFENFASTGITANPANGTILSRSTHDGIEITISYSDFSDNTDSLTIDKAPGSPVSAPTVNTYTSAPITITINAVTAPNGQNVEYNISTLNDGTDLGIWQTDTTFTGLLEGTIYYVYARSIENNDFLNGDANISAPITFYRVTFEANGGSPTPADQIILTGRTITAPANLTRSEFGFAGWYNNAAFTGNIWIFTSNTVTSNMTLFARWIPSTAGIALNIENITNKLPSPIDNITLSRTGSGSHGITQIISVVPNDYDAGSIRWEINGVGFYAYQIITETNASFTLDASDVRYNTVGGHTLRLFVKIDGVDYMRHINFTIVP